MSSILSIFVVLLIELADQFLEAEGNIEWLSMPKPVRRVDVEVERFVDQRAERICLGERH